MNGLNIKYRTLEFQLWAGELFERLNRAREDFMKKYSLHFGNNNFLELRKIFEKIGKNLGLIEFDIDSRFDNFFEDYLKEIFIKEYRDKISIMYFMYFYIGDEIFIKYGEIIEIINRIEKKLKDVPEDSEKRGIILKLEDLKRRIEEIFRETESKIEKEVLEEIRSIIGEREIEEIKEILQNTGNSLEQILTEYQKILNQINAIKPLEDIIKNLANAIESFERGNILEALDTAVENFQKTISFL